MARGPENYNNLPNLGAPAPMLASAGTSTALNLEFGVAVISIQITGTWTGTIIFESSQDEGLTWFATSVLGATGLGTYPSVTANGQFIFPCGGFTNFRARASSMSSGGPNVFLEASVAQPAVSFVASTASAQTISMVSPSSASTTFGVAAAGAGFNLDPFRSCIGYAKLQGGTGGVLDVYLQSSFDGGTTWMDCVHFPQLAAGAALTGYQFSLTRGDRASAGTLTVVNSTNNTPVLAANNIISDGFGVALRLACVAGASTTAGATQSILLLLATQ